MKLYVGDRNGIPPVKSWV